MSEAVNHFTIEVRKFIESWEPEELYLPSEVSDRDTNKDENRKVLRHRRPTKLFLGFLL